MPRPDGTLVGVRIVILAGGVGGSRFVLGARRAYPDAEITVVGNMVADPEIRFTQNGAAVASFTIASTPRNYDKASSEWKDGDSLFLRASVWREYAEQVAATLTKGCRVIATGRLKQRSYETKEGEKRTSMELDVDEIGPSLRYSTSVVTRVTRTGSPDRRAQPEPAQPDGGWYSPPAGDFTDETPF